MPRYFRYFPKTKHQGQLLLDITKRAKFKNTIAENPRVYLPYTVKNDESAEEVAHLYYGDVNLVWLVYLANDIIDPYKDWPMEQENFYDYIADKYKEEYKASTGSATAPKQSVLDWTMNEAIDDNVLYYENDDGDQISLETFTLGATFDSDFDADEWTKMTIFRVENEENENKRQIQVINKIYAEQVDKEFKRLMNE